MAKMIYIRQLNPKSFLHLSTNGEGFCLRDFSMPGIGPAIELVRQSGGRNARDIEKMAGEPGNKIINIEGHGRSVEEYTFWHEQTLRLNKQYVENSTQPNSNGTSKLTSWATENASKLIVAVASAILIAATLAWLGLKP